MISLLIKEINSFFGSLTGYIVVILFIIMNSLLLWIFPGDLSVLVNGYATLQSFFILSPWLMLILIPAITMKMFSEEKRSGTLELLLTKPLSDIQIILAKYLASMVLVLVSLLPTIVYYISVYLLGNPVGNIDSGAYWGSFTGLFFLVSMYVSIGIFASSVTDNQLVAFLITATICFIFFIGFDSIAQLPVFRSLNVLVTNIGINEHYKSLSRGVIDSRDIVYFISGTFIFILFSKTSLQSRKW